MSEVCRKNDRSESRQVVAEQRLRRELWIDLAIVLLLVQLVLGQYAATVKRGGLLLAVAIGLPAGLSRSFRLALLSVVAVLLGAGGIWAVRPTAKELSAALQILGGASSRRVELELVLTGDVERRAAGSGRATAIATIGEQKLKVLVTFPELPWVGRGYLASGDRLRAIGKFRAAADGEGIFGFGEWMLRRGIVGTVRVVHVNAIALGSGGTVPRESLIRSLRQRHALVDGFGIVIAGAIGVGDLISSEVVQLFKETGLTHLLVVSGYHVGVIFGAIYGGTSLAIRFVPRLLALAPAAHFAAAIALALGIFYVWFVGGTLTTLRALFSAILMLGARLLSRPVSPRRSLLIVLALCLSLWPGSGFEAGCQLTFAALSGLCYGGGWGAAVSPILAADGWSVQKLVNQLKSGLFASVGATLFTTPVMLCWFNTICPLTLLFNLLAGAIFSIIFILLAGGALLLCSLGITYADEAIAMIVWIAEWYLAALGAMADVVAATPFRYRELDPGVAKQLAAAIGVGLGAGVALWEWHSPPRHARIFESLDLKNPGGCATLPDRQDKTELKTF